MHPGNDRLPAPPESSHSQIRIQARLSLALLIAINLFNYIDRQVLAAVEPEIRAEMDRNLRAHASGLAALSVLDPSVTVDIDLSESTARSRMGFLSTAFLFSYMLFAPIFGWLADHFSRWKLIGVGVILWSLASGASGWDWGLGPVAAYWALLFTRCFVGIGEGGYGPVAPAMIADLFPVARRGQVMSWFYLAIPVGGALGYAFGEIVMSRWGWRWAFFLVVPPGVLLGLLCFFMRDVRPTLTSLDAQGHSLRGGLRAYASLFRIPSYVLNTLGMTAMTFAIGALAFWMPAFLQERDATPFLGIAPRTFFGVITAFSGLLATLGGGLAGDWLRRYHSGSYFIVSAVAMFLGAPMILGFLYAPFPLAWVFVFAAVFCLFFNTGPTNTILANVTPASVRASAFAMNILIIHILGDAISPPIIGYLSGRSGDDAVGGPGGADIGFFLIAAIVALGGVFWLWGAAHLERDTARAAG